MISISYDKELDAAIFTFAGDRDYAEVCAAITEYYKGPLTKYTLWDFTKVDNSKQLSSEETQKIGLHAESYKHFRPNGVDILVVPSLLQYGLARMYFGYSEKYGDKTKKAKTKIFRSKEDAIAFMKKNNAFSQDTI